MTPCQSSLLCGFGYDPAAKVLSIQFKEGGPIYNYAAAAGATHGEFARVA